MRSCLLLAALLLAVSLPSLAFTPGYPEPSCEINRELYLATPYLRGEDVRELQERLRQLGFYRGKPDGVFNPRTEQALKRFQRARGLPETGRLPPEAWLSLAGEETPGTGGKAAGGKAAPPPGPLKILVDVSRLTLTVLSGEKPYRTYPIAIGKWHTPTPVGEFIIRDKEENPGGAFGSRWMGLNVPWGSYGIHGTNRPWSIGSAASAGCIRMNNHDVEEIFPWIAVGTRVIIVGYEPEATIYRLLQPGHTGTDVQYLQYRLRRAGFDPGPLDGWYGESLEKSVRELQLYYDLPVTGTAGSNELTVLGLK